MTLICLVIQKTNRYDMDGIARLAKEREYSDKAYILPSCPRLQRLNFQTGQNLSQLAWVGRKIYQLFNRSNFAAICRFKFVKICVFRAHPSFTRFHTGYNFDQISRKCSGNFQRHKC